MREIPQDLRVEYEDASKRNAVLFRTIARISLVGLLLLVAIHIILSRSESAYPLVPMVIVNMISFVGVIFSLQVHLRGRFSRAVAMYLGTVVLTLVTSLYFLGGTQSPLSKAFIIVILFAGLLGKRNSALWFFVTIVGVIILLFILSIRGFLPPPAIQESSMMILDNFVLVIALIVTLALTTRVVLNNEVVEKILIQRELELSTAVHNAEIALQTESEARQRERVFIEQLRQLVQTYATYLERIGEGDYTTQLNFLEQDYTEVPELIHLGQGLRDTVGNLTNRLDEAETAQMMYIQQAWESFVQQGFTPSGFVFEDQDKSVSVSQDAWLPVMDRALASKGFAIEDADLGIGLGMRGAWIGALGLKRKDRSVWSEDEVAMVRDIVDQLTQTIERLRLVDDISRRAALEAMGSKVTDSIRAEVDIEAVLERALAELGAALQADRGYAQLTFVEEREDAV